MDEITRKMIKDPIFWVGIIAYAVLTAFLCFMAYFNSECGC